MADQISFAASRGFFIDLVSLDGGDLTLVVGDGVASIAKVIFEKPTGFFFFRESDHYEKMSQYKTETLVPTNSADCGIFRVLAGSMIQSQRVNEGQDVQNEWFMLVATPQECIEVAGWEAPKIVAH